MQLTERDKIPIGSLDWHGNRIPGKPIRCYIGASDLDAETDRRGGHNSKRALIMSWPNICTSIGIPYNTFNAWVNRGIHPHAAMSKLHDKYQKKA